MTYEEVTVGDVYKDSPVSKQVMLLKNSIGKEDKAVSLIRCMKTLLGKQNQCIAELTAKASNTTGLLSPTSLSPQPSRKESNLSLSILNRPTEGKFAKLLGMCNPLLDMSLSVPDSFLEKWGLEADNAVLANENTVELFDEMTKDERTSYIPGGSGLNSMRVAQWVLGAPNSTVFVGTTGEDDFGEILHGTTQTEGVGMLNLTISDEQTGTCAVLTTKDNKRSLVANLGASNVFKREWLDTKVELKNALDSCSLYYITGFFLRTTPETVMEVMRIGNRRGKTVCLNLSAPFVIQAVGKGFAEAFAMSNIVFGNNAEYLALDEVMEWDLKDMEKIAKKVQSLPGVRNRIVVVTQGSDDVCTVSKTGVTYYPTPSVPSADIVDTNGAGDGFVGGFLAKYSKGGKIEECVKIGQWAASIIIRRPGCSIPPLPPGCCVSMAEPLPDRRPNLSHATVTKTAKKQPKQNGAKKDPVKKEVRRLRPIGTRHVDPKA
eukprot:TRINITY_DN9087_c0_g1_i1.p1 TRINITY_DN9087_c0_g1~~TRINITY_DN9087_c0_g1_i1.p1  ORF type:complete len:570 (+),score=109.01 TRINITY_DN9087_c0_g1_i1:245-1711(+)